MQVSATLPRSPSAADLIAGGTEIAMGAEYPLRSLSPNRPSEYINKVSVGQIDREDSAVLDWAKQHNRLFSSEEVSKFSNRSQNRNGGNKEHDAWQVITPSGAVVIRRTKGGMYGLPFRSPLQYLQRMVDVSAQIPQAPISFLGVSKNPQGAGEIWTVQPYIEGVHPSDLELQKFLKTNGWSLRTDQQHNYYRHSSGIRMHDAHAGNFIKIKDEKIIPIDVFFEGLE